MVFSGTLEQWTNYLAVPSPQRYEPGWAVHVDADCDARQLHFHPLSEAADPLSNLLDWGLENVRQALEEKKGARRLLDELLFPAGRANRTLSVCASRALPSLASTETGPLDAESQPVQLVFQYEFLLRTLEAMKTPKLSGAERLGYCWPLLHRFLSGAAFPLDARNRFAAKIDVFAKVAYVALHLLYDKGESGRLKCTTIGAVVEAMASEAANLSRNELWDSEPYYRMLGTIGFALRAKTFEDCATELRIAARSYLDALYLRMSLAGAMPDLAPEMVAMPFERQRQKIKTPNPVVGRYGIIDEEDRDAWKQVHKRFKDLGYTLIRQLGVGQFGRVYEAVALGRGTTPERLAIKVDRIVGKKKRAILESEMAMDVGRALAPAPHLIRLFDTGKLPGIRYTYHVLQLIDGDTLDALLGVQGLEHASIDRPHPAMKSEREVRRIFTTAMQRRPENYARRSSGFPFRRHLSPLMTLDVLTEVLTTVEEVHHLGYAINDLKNDNLMLSRRGQLKGIDLDSYSAIHSDIDKYTDFLFLASSLLFILLGSAKLQRRSADVLDLLAENPVSLRNELRSIDSLQAVDDLSQGRLTRDELVEYLGQTVSRSRSLEYARNPNLFSRDVTRLLQCKYRLNREQFVID